MAVYNIDGIDTDTAYDIDGTLLNQAYDIDGNELLDDNQLKVMSYNVQYWRGNNGMKSIQNIAFGDGADIVGIQEWGTAQSPTIDGTDCISYLNSFGYTDVTVTSLDYNHKAVASKYPMTNKSETVYNQSIETRSYTKSYFEFNGKTIAFFNTHTDYQLNSTIKFAQIQELLTAVSNEEYFILTGDLNTTCTNKAETEYLNCVQPFIDAGYNVANSPVGEDLIWTYYNGATVAESTQITPTDNIITSSNIAIIDVYTIDTKLTANTGNVIDHIPLVAVLQIDNDEVTQ